MLKLIIVLIHPYVSDPEIKAPLGNWIKKYRRGASKHMCELATADEYRGYKRMNMNENHPDQPT